MNPDNDRSYMRVKKVTVAVIILILAAGLFGWWLGNSNDAPANNSANNQTSNTSPPTNNKDSPTTNNDAGLEVKSLVSYTLPDGWKEGSCASTGGPVYIVPNGAGNVDCDANPSSPVKISMDPANNKDCNQLQSVQNVSKHICVSEFINSRKSLKAETIYNKDSSYKKETAINAYYIDTGKGVVKVEYTHDPGNNEYQAGFEQLAKSVQVK